MLGEFLLIAGLYYLINSDKKNQDKKIKLDVTSGILRKNNIIFNSWKPGKPIISLIIGHSKNTPGSCNNHGFCEYPYNKILVEKIFKILSPNYNLVLTHRDNLNQYLDELKFINSLNPDLVLSFHLNYDFNSKVSGSEIWHYPGNKKSKRLAEIILKEIIETLHTKNRGVKSDNGSHLHILKYIKSPIILLETFYLSNKNDLEKGIDKINQLSKNISNGINKYYGVKNERLLSP